MKRAFVSEKSGTLTLSVIRDANPRMQIAIDFCLPTMPVLSLELPFPESEAENANHIFNSGLAVLIEQLHAFLSERGFEEDEIIATIERLYQALSLYKEEPPAGGIPRTAAIDVDEKERTLDRLDEIYELVSKKLHTYRTKFPKPLGYKEVEKDLVAELGISEELAALISPAVNLRTSTALIAPYFKADLEKILRSPKGKKATMLIPVQGEPLEVHEISFPITEGFWNQIQQHEISNKVAADYTNRAMEFELRLQNRTQDQKAKEDAAAVISRYKNNIYKNSPGQMFVVLYDRNGRPTGTARVTNQGVTKFADSWKNYVRGEYWLNISSGHSIECENGDYTHESYAVECILGDKWDAIIAALEENIERFRAMNPNDVPDIASAEIEELEDEWRQIETASPEDLGEDLIHTILFDTLPSATQQELFDGDLSLFRKDIRGYFMKHYGEIRVINNNFEVWKLTPSAMGAITDFALEIGGEEMQADPKTEIMVEEVSTGQWASVPMKHFMTMKQPGQLWRTHGAVVAGLMDGPYAPYPVDLKHPDERFLDNPRKWIADKQAMKKISYVSKCRGHRDSDGELAEWCVKSHDTGKILSSHKTKAEAAAHLKQMHIFKNSLFNQETFNFGPTLNSNKPTARSFNHAPNFAEDEKAEFVVSPGQKEAADKLAHPINVPSAILNTILGHIEGLAREFAASFDDSSWMASLGNSEIDYDYTQLFTSSFSHIPKSSMNITFGFSNKSNKSNQLMVSMAESHPKTGDIKIDVCRMTREEVLGQWPDCLLLDIKQALAHELTHVLQHFLGGDTAPYSGFENSGTELKAITSELIVAYRSVLQSNPDCSIEQFLSNSWVWQQIRGRNERERRRIIRDISQAFTEKKARLVQSAHPPTSMLRNATGAVCGNGRARGRGLGSKEAAADPVPKNLLRALTNLTDILEPKPWATVFVPDTSGREHMTTLTLDVKKRIEALRKTTGLPLPLLGEGSSRCVFGINEHCILKLAKNRAGIGQTEAEYEVFEQVEDCSIITHVLYYAEDFEWIIAEKANQTVTDEDFEFYGFEELSDMIDVVDGYHSYSGNHPLAERTIKELRFLAKTLGVLSGDMEEYQNWGIVDRGGEQYPVMIDYGFTAKVRRQHYSSPLLNKEAAAEAMEIDSGEGTSREFSLTLESRFGNWGIAFTVNPGDDIIKGTASVDSSDSVMHVQGKTSNDLQRDLLSKIDWHYDMLKRDLKREIAEGHKPSYTYADLEMDNAKLAQEMIHHTERYLGPPIPKAKWR